MESLPCEVSCDHGSLEYLYLEAYHMNYSFNITQDAASVSRCGRASIQ